MRIVVDENVEGELVIALRTEGYEVIEIKLLHPGLNDAGVLAIAAEQTAVLFTNDKDFGELVYRERLFSTGVVLLRFGKLDLPERADLLKQVLREQGKELESSFTVISPTGVRIRR